MTVEEDRIYDDRREGAVAVVASELGVVVVELAGSQIGRFRVDRRGDARDVDADEVVAVATDEDVYVYDPDAEDPYRPTDFGPAVAVGVDGDNPVAATADRRICRRVDGDWFDLATIDHDVRAVNGDLVAAADGIYRADPDGLDHVGLDDGRDVAWRGPYAATGDGLYELANGWMKACDGAFDVVACSPDRDRAHAASGSDVYAREDDEWVPIEVPADAPVAGFGYAAGDVPATYAITVEGRMLAREVGDEEWRTRHVGVDGVRGLAIR